MATLYPESMSERSRSCVIRGRGYACAFFTGRLPVKQSRVSPEDIVAAGAPTEGLEREPVFLTFLCHHATTHKHADLSDVYTGASPGMMNECLAVYSYCVLRHRTHFLS